jgi:hypothetical protein
VKPYRWNVSIECEKTQLLGGETINTGPTRIEVSAEFIRHSDAQEFEAKVREMLGEE